MQAVRGEEVVLIEDDLAERVDARIGDDRIGVGRLMDHLARAVAAGPEPGDAGGADGDQSEGDLAIRADRGGAAREGTPEWQVERARPAGAGLELRWRPLGHLGVGGCDESGGSGQRDDEPGMRLEPDDAIWLARSMHDHGLSLRSLPSSALRSVGTTSRSARRLVHRRPGRPRDPPRVQAYRAALAKTKRRFRRAFPRHAKSRAALRSSP